MHNLKSVSAPGANRVRTHSRAVTLVATVLITALAATIALVAVRQTILITRAEGARTDYSRAHNEALLVQAEFERLLRDDPYFYTKQVFPWERPRRCSTPPASATPVFYASSDKRLSSKFPYALPPTNPRDPSAGMSALPDQPVGTWPASCGATWVYPSVGPVLKGYRPQMVRAEITPPSNEDPQITLKILARVGTSETGIVATYRVPAVSELTMYSPGDIDLENTLVTDTTPANTTPVTGKVYSNSKIVLPSANLPLGVSTLISEKGFIGTVTSTATRLFTTLQDPKSPPERLGNIRDEVSSPLRWNELTTSVNNLSRIGCSDATSATAEKPINYPVTSAFGDYSSYLCLYNNKTIIDQDNTETILPAAKAYMVIPDDSRLRIYSTTQDPDLSGECVLRCDVAKLATSPLHPASALPTTAGQTNGLWTYHGSFRYPASGVIAADKDVFFSRCEGFASNGECGSATFPGRNGTTPGSTAEKSVTILAGTLNNPRNVWVQGPVGLTNASTNARVGVVATNQVKIPYWANTRGGNLKLQMSMVAFGLGDDSSTTQAITPFPSALAGPFGATDPNWGGVLTITGSVASPGFNNRLGNFKRVEVIEDAVLKTSAPPSFPGFASAPLRVSSQRLSSEMICSGQTEQGPGCYGVW